MIDTLRQLADACCGDHRPDCPISPIWAKEKNLGVTTPVGKSRSLVTSTHTMFLHRIDSDRTARPSRCLVFRGCRALELNRNGEGRTQLRRPMPQPPRDWYAVAALLDATGQLSGKAKGRDDPRARRPARLGRDPFPSGVTGGEQIHDYMTLPDAGSRTRTRSILGSALFGALLLFVAGFSQPDALHAATHDTRHAYRLSCN